MLNILVLVLFSMKEIKDGLAAGTSLLSTLDSHCTDYSGRIYEHGMHYMPKNMCNLCICDNGEPKGCKMVLCTAPSECKSFQLGNNCCEYVCLDDTLAERTTDFVNRLRQRKIRGRENRQTTSDERSIVGSIGYITGNMGYMEGNINGMDYTYGNSSHYPLWKPPSGYFPRGEAPPPYEEAVALSQAEALSAAQCTVSVATTTHRSLPISTLNVAEGEIHQPQNPQQQNITTSTTNLINININSGGNVTTVATGESHQPPYS